MALVNGKKVVKSPYARHHKAPYQYSALYHQWRGAVRKGNDGEARALAAKHFDTFGRGGAINAR